MKKIIKHIRRWNKWRKKCLNSKLHKFLVLIGLIKSPTMAYVLLDSEEKIIWNAFTEGLKRGFMEGENDRSEHD